MNSVLKLIKSTKSSTSKKRAQQVQALYEKHHQELLNSIMAKGLIKVEAEDVVQEAYIKLLGIEDDKVDSYIKAYLYRIASNLAIDKLRRGSRSPFIEGIDVENQLNERSSLERSQQSKQLFDKITESIKSLPLNCRQAFVLYKVKGASYAEIAQMMQVSESMIRKHVLTAIKHVHKNVMQD